LKCDGTCAETRFRLTTKRTSPFQSAGGGGASSVYYWQASCTHQPAGFVLLVQASVLQSCDAYWLPTPFYCFPFTSSPVRHRVPSHFNWTLPLDGGDALTSFFSLFNSVALDRERTILTERPPPVGEVSANFLRIEGCHVVSARDPHGRLTLFSSPGAATSFYSSSSSIDVTRLSGLRSRPTTLQKIW
jgi:hypothetical protein